MISLKKFRPTVTQINKKWTKTAGIRKTMLLYDETYDLQQRIQSKILSPVLTLINDTMPVPMETIPAVLSQTSHSLMVSDSTLRELAELLLEADGRIGRTQGLNLKSHATLQHLQVKYCTVPNVLYCTFLFDKVTVCGVTLCSSFPSISSLRKRRNKARSFLWLKWQKIY